MAYGCSHRPIIPLRSVLIHRRIVSSWRVWCARSRSHKVQKAAALWAEHKQRIVDMSDDFCVVCAEPLDWVAYAACGHKETCSKCVVRLRVVLEDPRCVICQQTDGAVMVTRFSGAYTASVPATDFPELKVTIPKGPDFICMCLRARSSSINSRPRTLVPACSLASAAPSPVDPTAGEYIKRWFSLHSEDALDLNGL